MTLTAKEHGQIKQQLADLEVEIKPLANKYGSLADDVFEAKSVLLETYKAKSNQIVANTSELSQLRSSAADHIHNSNNLREHTASIHERSQTLIDQSTQLTAECRSLKQQLI